jgi:hypothetical protein
MKLTILLAVIALLDAIFCTLLNILKTNKRGSTSHSTTYSPHCAWESEKENIGWLWRTGLTEPCKGFARDELVLRKEQTWL